MHLILIDGSGFLHRAFHSAPKNMVRSDGTPVGAINSFCSMIWRLVGKFGHATHMAVIGDAGGKTWRHDLDPQYKANRGEKEPELKVQLAMMEDSVRAFGLPYIARVGKEADDIIATYASRWAEMQMEPTARYANRLVTIVSSDKDLMQLITERIIMFEPRNEVWVKTPDVVNKFGVEPHQIVDYLAMVGDSIDNIKGLPSIGEKTASALLAAYGSIKGIRGNLDKLNQRQQRLFDEDGEHAIQLELAVKLVTLWRDVKGLPDPAGFAWQRDRDYRDLAAYCRSNEMESLARRVQEDWHQ
jgi:DNA polymerase I